jgi:hypothetical protein
MEKRWVGLGWFMGLQEEIMDAFGNKGKADWCDNKLTTW